MKEFPSFNNSTTYIGDFRDYNFETDMSLGRIFGSEKRFEQALINIANLYGNAEQAMKGVRTLALFSIEKKQNSEDLTFKTDDFNTAWNRGFQNAFESIVWDKSFMGHRDKILYVINFLVRKLARTTKEMIDSNEVDLNKLGDIDYELALEKNMDNDQIEELNILAKIKNFLLLAQGLKKFDQKVLFYIVDQEMMHLTGRIS